MVARQVDSSKAGGWQQGSWMAARQVDGSKAVGWQQGRWMAARQVDGSKAGGWQQGRWMAARQVDGSKAGGWQQGRWTVVRQVVDGLLRTDSWYVSECFVASGLPTVRIWNRANAGCHSWNPLTCLLSCF